MKQPTTLVTVLSLVTSLVGPACSKPTEQPAERSEPAGGPVGSGSQAPTGKVDVPAPAPALVPLDLSGLQKSWGKLTMLAPTTAKATLSKDGEILYVSAGDHFSIGCSTAEAGDLELEKKMKLGATGSDKVQEYVTDKPDLLVWQTAGGRFEFASFIQVAGQGYGCNSDAKAFTRAEIDLMIQSATSLKARS